MIYISPQYTCFHPQLRSQEECISTSLKRCRHAGGVTLTTCGSAAGRTKPCAYLDFSGFSDLVIFLSQEQPCAYIDLTSSISTSLRLLCLWNNIHFASDNTRWLSDPNHALENTRSGPSFRTNFLRTGFGNRLSMQAEVKSHAHLAASRSDVAILSGNRKNCPLCLLSSPLDMLSTTSHREGRL